MLPTAQLEKNQAKFKETNLKYNIFTKELEDFLGVGFYTAPASSTLSMIGCYPGGLLHHLIKACKYSIQVNEIVPESLRQNPASIIKVVFLSQIGKVFAFLPNTNEWSIKQGKMYEFNDDTVRLRVGERYIYYALNHGVKLTEEEYQAILNLDKDNDDKMSKYFSSPLTQIIRNGFDLAIMEEKNGKKRN
jgi:hypothetical protein